MPIKLETAEIDKLFCPWRAELGISLNRQDKDKGV